MKWAKFSKTILGFTTIAIFLAFSNLYAIADEEMATQEPQSVFEDVDVGSKNYIAIKYLKENDIINGYEDNTFKPKAEINRAEALKLISKATGMFNEEKYTEDENPVNIFSDVGPQDWFYKYIKVAKENNIINGYENGSFKPENIVNLVEALKILINSDETIDENSVENANFADIDSEGWYIKYVSYAASKDMLNINNDNTIAPSQLLTRGYLAEIIYRYLMTKNSTNFIGFGKATYYGAAVQGHGTASGETFDMNLFTAAHKTLPFGTIVRATNLTNGKAVEVKINDRGPYGPGRVLDLSSSAFKELAPLSTGVINIQYEIIPQ